MPLDGQSRAVRRYDFDQQRQAGKLAGAMAAGGLDVTVGKGRARFDHLASVTLNDFVGEPARFDLNRRGCIREGAVNLFGLDGR